MAKTDGSSDAAGLGWQDLLKPIAAVIGAGLGAWQGREQWEEERESLQSIIDELRDAFDEEVTKGETRARALENAFDLVIGDAEELHGFNVAALREAYWQSIEENVEGQGETRRDFNQRVINTLMQKEVATGQQATQAAQSGVRKTGSAGNLISETARMFDVDVAEIDKQLAAEVAKYGRQRGRLKESLSTDIEREDIRKRQAIEGAQGQFESGIEAITGTDINFEDYFSGEKSFLELMGEDWARDTLLTRPIRSGIVTSMEDYLRHMENEDKAMWMGGLEGALTGWNLF